VPAFLASIDWTQILIGAIGAGLGTWFGAWAAFKHERRDREETEHRQQGEALKRALFVLLSQRTVLVNIRDQHLAEHETHRLRHVLLPPFYVAGDELPLDLEPLMFVLNTSNADLLNRLQVCNRSYRTILATIDLRNKVHLEGQGVMGRVRGESATDDEIKEMIGRERWAQLKDFTDALYQAVPKTLAWIDANYDAVEALAKKEFPEVKLFKIERLTP
jgi:hypothetical protein